MQRCRSHVVGSTGICGGALDSRASFDPFLAEFSRAAREGRGTRVRAFMRAAGGFGGGTAACDLRGLPPRPPPPLVRQTRQLPTLGHRRKEQASL